MNHEEEQLQELEALRSIYPSELEILSESYPKIRFRITVAAEAESNSSTEAPIQLDAVIEVGFPKNYPEIEPEISLEGLEEEVGEERNAKVIGILKETLGASLGMAMVFGLVSTLQVNSTLNLCNF